MNYELTPITTIKTAPAVGRVKMTKTTNAPEAKPVKKYQKSRGEHAKDILIAVLITSVIAFIGGMHFANKHNAEVQNAVKSATVNAEVKK